MLGAGNVASIGPLDVVYKLFAEGQVCILKMNPVNEYLGPIHRGGLRGVHRSRLLASGLRRRRRRRVPVPARHVDEIHITGSDKTHDAIVYGIGEEGEERKEKDEPLNKKRITSELGNVSPIIVVPGKWSESELDFHAENIASHARNNGGFNCNAARVIITPRGLAQRARPPRCGARRLTTSPQRYPYYPGAESVTPRG